MSKENGGIEYFGIYPDPDPYRDRFRLKKTNMESGKSERNQRIADQHKLDRKSGLLNRQISDVERAIIRAQRQGRLEGVTLYVRDAVGFNSEDY